MVFMGMVVNDSDRYMHLALDEARKGLGRTRPNPAVGAVIVRDGQVLGRGYHPAAGEPHAEIFALRDAGVDVSGATAYVTLEPCSHQGRTGPCADALIAAGIKRVVVGAVDPNPQVSGRGIERLRQAGVEVEVGVCGDDCQELIVPFAWHIRESTPFTIYKAAMTFDGQVATASGDSRWVSSEESRLRVHQLRDRVDAIMVGVDTIIADDPQLTTRLPGGGRDPLRVVVDSGLRLPLESRVVRQTSSAATLVACTTRAPSQRVDALKNCGCEVLRLPELAGRVDLRALWSELGGRELQYLLLEGGRTLARAALEAGLINRMQLYLAPKLLGGSGQAGLFSGQGCDLMRQARPLTDLRVETIGEDLLVTAEVITCLPA